MAWSGSVPPWPVALTPRFVNNDYVTAEITYSTAHEHHKVFAWSWATLCRKDIWAPPREWQHHCCVAAVFVGLAAGGETIACPLPQLLRQPGERLCCVRLCYVCCYSCCTIQERIDMSAVPTAPHIFFKPLSSHLAYHEFSEQCTQCEQQDRWHDEQDQRYTRYASRRFSFPLQDCLGVFWIFYLKVSHCEESKVSLLPEQWDKWRKKGWIKSLLWRPTGREHGTSDWGVEGEGWPGVKGSRIKFVEGSGGEPLLVKGDLMLYPMAEECGR